MKQHLLMLFLLFAFQVKAAERFLVYNVTKQVHWLHDGKKESIKRGVFVLPKQSIVVTFMSDVMLVQENGKSLLLDKPGNYNFEQLASLFAKTKTNSATSNFFAYVFEKFFSGKNDAEQQKIAAVVYRGKKTMISPADSSFVFSNPVLNWKPEQINIPFKITITVNNVLFDTVLRKQTSLPIPERLFTGASKKAFLIKWYCIPADSKQAPAPFVILIPETKDAAVIQSQLKALKLSCKNNLLLYRSMQKDLLEQWIHTYQL